MLIQDAAYGLLLQSARQQHHQRVAETLAERFPEIAETRPELLAHHFTEAGLVKPAMEFWLRAARRAVERSANVEASGHVQQGLALLERLPASPTREGLELGLSSMQGSAAIALKGYGAPEVERAFARALELCGSVGDPGQRFRAEVGLWTYYVVRADYGRAREIADRLTAMARARGSAAAAVHAAYCAGFSRYYVGDLQASCDAFLEGAATPAEDGDPALLLPTGDDVRIHLLAFLALVLWHLGRPTEAVARADEAVSMARRLGHPYGVAFALNGAAYLALCLRDGARATEALGECLAVSMDKGYRFFLLMGGFVRGWLLAQAGSAEEGFAAMARSVQAARGAGARMGETLMMVHFADACLRQGRVEEAREWLDQMAAAVAETGERFFEPDLHRLRGECLLLEGGPGAEAAFRSAIEQAQRHGDRALELRGAAALARLASGDAGRRREARGLLAALVGAYPAAAETSELREARALVERLA